jgi:pentatricopeptide repeat protein
MQVMDRIKQAGVRPDLTMINTAVKACCLAGAMEEAEELLDSMKVNATTTLLLGILQKKLVKL